jgi:hypothetical protein
LEVSAHGDDPLRASHFEYHLWVVRDGHEFCQSWSPNNGVVPAVETRHLEPQELSSVVLWGSEGDGHVDVTYWVISFCQHDAKERGIRLSEVGDGDPQSLKCLGKSDVDDDATIHKHLLNLSFSDHRVNM